MNGTQVHFWQIQVGGRTELRGYVHREGRIAGVDAVVETDEQCRQKKIVAQVSDTAGRKVKVTGEHFAHFPLVPVPSCTLIDGAMRCEVDGRPGVGWSEFM